MMDGGPLMSSKLRANTAICQQDSLPTALAVDVSKHYRE
jgi:hypothetical protein